MIRSNRLIAVGDIHGQADSLTRLLQTINPNKDTDTFVFVGDYIDRGPESKRVIDILITLSQHYKCVFLRGNHEDMFLGYLGLEDDKYSESDFLRNEVSLPYRLTV